MLRNKIIGFFTRDARELASGSIELYLNNAASVTLNSDDKIVKKNQMESSFDA